MALRGSKIENFNELWCLMASRGLDICVLSTSFQKNDMGWPQQPLQEEYQISVKLRILMIHSTKRDWYWSFGC